MTEPIELSRQVHAELCDFAHQAGARSLDAAVAVLLDRCAELRRIRALADQALEADVRLAEVSDYPELRSDDVI